uniref:HAT C-terminal dimerisation domain-containing protein n=1 Tax=Salvator merianae TaxID=96440 RepID=A0A8D0CFW7_SALMN
MVTNGAPNLARVAEQLQFVSIPCVVHTLNLVVQEALGFSGAAARQEAPAEGAAGPPSDAAVAVLVDKCRRIGGYFHRSEKAEHVLSCLCDPRMKGKAVTPDQLPRWRALLVEEVRQVQERRLGCKQEEGAGAPASSGLSTPSSSSGSSVTALASQPSGTMPLASPRELAERCVLQYLQEPVAGWEMEPIQFWATHHQVWPDLATVAERFLSCPPSSVQRERVFSMAADGVTPYSLRLETELVEQLVFLKANLPLLGYPEATTIPSGPAARPVPT